MTKRAIARRVLVKQEVVKAEGYPKGRVWAIAVFIIWAYFRFGT